MIGSVRQPCRCLSGSAICDRDAVELHYAIATDEAVRMRMTRAAPGSTLNWLMLCDDHAMASRKYDASTRYVERHMPPVYMRLALPDDQHDATCVEVMCHAFIALSGCRG